MHDTSDAVPPQRRALSTAEMAAAVADPVTAVVLVDEDGMSPAAWGLGAGHGATAIRAAYSQRSRTLCPGDRGVRLDARTVEIQVGSNSSLPPALRLYAWSSVGGRRG